MAIQFAPKRKSILLCDFSKGGFLPPEMVKRRPVLVIFGRSHARTGLATIVPLSTTETRGNPYFVVPIQLATPLPHPFEAKRMFAKCDMITTVGFHRLDLFRSNRNQKGKRAYTNFQLDDEQFASVLTGIKYVVDPSSS
jgi:uncharacterized protein YifN (PemK superfamily)